MNPVALRSLVATYKALAHPVRLRMLAMLADGELCVCQLTAVLGLAASTVSAHLAELRRGGLASERKSGRWVLYRLADGEQVATLVARIRTELAADPQAAQDRAVCRRLRRVPVEELCRAELDLERVGIRRPGSTTTPSLGDKVHR